MESFRTIRKRHFKNPLMSYLNINSLRKKIINLREVEKFLELDYFVISETNIDESFSSQQFTMDNLRSALEKIGTVMEVVY